MCGATIYVCDYITSTRIPGTFLESMEMMKVLDGDFMETFNRSVQTQALS